MAEMWFDQRTATATVAQTRPPTVVDGGPMPLGPVVGRRLEAVQRRPHRRPPIARRVLVRGLDLLGAGLLAVVAIPAMLAVALVLAVFDWGPIVFRQPRVGRDGVVFGCLKFRTMRPDADAALAGVLRDPARLDEWRRTQKLQDDPRVTRLGATLRRLDLDELPQLFNVVRGEMSLVGPRPVIVPEAERYGDALGEVLSVRPGLTGAWQVSGRNAIAYPERVDLDLTYVRTRSLSGDLSILARTLGVVLRKADRS